jgi:ribosome biogenesis GTPase
VASLEALGWDEGRSAERERRGDPALVGARVAAVERGGLLLAGLDDDPAVVRPAHSRLELRSGLEAPTVGDWVLCRASDGVLSVEKVMTRSSCFVRKAAGRRHGAQLVAANIDRVLVVTAVGDDLSPRRLERYLAAIYAGGAEPVVVVNKCDRPHDPEHVVSVVAQASSSVAVVMTSARAEGGLDALAAVLVPRTTLALVGSSGVGKSTLVNRLAGAAFATAPVREADDKGRHTTSRRELVVTPTGVILIDTPGMRELGLWDASSGLATAFADVEELAQACRFRDCRHASEPGCALRQALDEGLLPPERLASYRRLALELEQGEEREELARRRRSEVRATSKSIHKGLRTRRRLHGKLGLKDR